MCCIYHLATGKAFHSKALPQPSAHDLRLSPLVILNISSKLLQADGCVAARAVQHGDHAVPRVHPRRRVHSTTHCIHRSLSYRSTTHCIRCPLSYHSTTHCIHRSLFFKIAPHILIWVEFCPRHLQMLGAGHVSNSEQQGLTPFHDRLICQVHVCRACSDVTSAGRVSD